ncbi:MAG TPA: hypothetical protein ENN29_09075 [Candidatus Hydrogenedentes bacterium]|nr:hypothetical protein [Candidatus Hydrogenedentota bacterium]
MRLPLISGYLELDPPPRRFLMYVAINVVSWQNIVGPATILFARKIDMPESLVGAMLSFMPFSTLLLLFTVPLIIRLGPKRVMMTAWLMRNIITCLVFLMPLALATGSKRLAWGVLLAAVFGFCVMRAFGAGGWLPWLHEIVPVKKRSVYFSTEAAITQLINVAVLFTQARLLAVSEPGVNRFLLIFGLGIVMGFISLLWMRRIPGGEGAPQVDAVSGLNALKRAVSDRSFLVFMLVSIFGMTGLSWFGAAYVMYLRDALGARDSLNMSLSAMGGLGILLTVGSWARFTEQNGSGLSMAKTLTAHALAPLLFLLAGAGYANTTALPLLAVVIACVFNAAFHVAVNRAMLNHVPDHDRVGYTAVWTVCTALTLGATPLVAGFIIEYWGMWGFRACFLFSIFTTLGGAALSMVFVHERVVFEKNWTEMLNPALPLRTMGRILWITLGLHESNRNNAAAGKTPE